MNCWPGARFSRALNDDSNNAVILNRSAIERMGLTVPEEAAKSHIQYSRSPPIRIIGVVEDFHMQSLHDAAGPMQLRLLRRGGGQSAIRLQARNIPDGISAIEASWASVFPHYPLAYSFLDEDFERLYQSEQRTANLLGAFSLLAIFIACLGLFGLTSFAIRQRTREVGIHKVMGASATRIVYMLSKDFLKLVAMAVPVAWVLAYLAYEQLAAELRLPGRHRPRVVPDRRFPGTGHRPGNGQCKSSHRRDGESCGDPAV